MMKARISIVVVTMAALLLLPGDGRTQEEAFFADTVDVELERRVILAELELIHDDPGELVDDVVLYAVKLRKGHD